MIGSADFALSPLSGAGANAGATGPGAAAAPASFTPEPTLQTAPPTPPAVTQTQTVTRIDPTSADQPGDQILRGLTSMWSRTARTLDTAGAPRAGAASSPTSPSAGLDGRISGAASLTVTPPADNPGLSASESHYIAELHSQLDADTEFQDRMVNATTVLGLAASTEKNGKSFLDTMLKGT